MSTSDSSSAKNCHYRMCSHAFREEIFKLRDNRGNLLVRYSKINGPTTVPSISEVINENNIDLNIDDSSITIFYIHGSMATMTMFDDIIGQFEGKFNIVAYDALGCGNSDKPIEPSELYSTSNLFEDFSEVFEKYATKRVIFVGHSFGTTQVARMVRRIFETESFFGYDVLATILIGSNYHVPDGGNPIFQLPVWLLQCFRQKMSDAFLEKGLSPKCNPAVRQLCIQNSGKNDLNIVKAFYTQFRWATEEDWFALCGTNTLVVHGEDDRILLKEGAEKLVDNLDIGLKGEGIEQPILLYETIPDCAHQVMMETPEALMEIMQRFLSEYL